ncbi:subunit C of vacuolar H+-ATPase V1 [Ordospora colligata]|uniref:V-type proton ATPase subunit C n=1 Tax=Ordospora colligata OC4 TaxID=1354746 RepID=A0A0B2ULH1_9MICR|nr:subunit C of vacuolar H+-ATPase V1 [Ordospora colligata OC4]KHN70134.1 subunit C of vacuolar H+-ATPase V1 [Ordospora colligata OC4]TBU16516.1 subunit C of vacuolar H+-ATPase V1 [Ordospora colligata]TBU16557.1 subunit C of vacuolar H+-ATPase V1 [Ordospora colligata]TBU19130.1 subunit C of vacuolar H+-ATPase V1 [Ordospora colligata]
MFVFMGLPVDDGHAQLTEDQIWGEHGVLLNRILLPSFTGVSLEGIVNQVERLCSLQKTCEGLLKTFSKQEATVDAEESRVNLKFRNMKDALRWDEKCFMTDSIDKAIALLEKECTRISERFNTMVEEFIHAKTECEKLQRLTRGSLSEISLNIIVENDEHYEFLKVLYVVVPKARVNEFKRMVNESPYISEDAVASISSDEDYCLFKMYVLQHNEDEVRSGIHMGGFTIKELDQEGTSCTQITKERRAAEEKYSSSEECLIRFVHVNLDEALKILIHTKLLKLFVESVYRYGLPTDYAFFVINGEKTKIMKQLVPIARGWPSERIAYDEDGEINDEEDVFFALEELDLSQNDE